MKKLIFLLFCVLLWLAILFTVINTDVIAEDVVLDEYLSSTELIKKYGGENAKLILAIAKCESGLNENAINYNDGGKGKHSVGIMQFQEATFKYWAKKMGNDYDYYSKLDQIKVASYMIKEKQAGQWSCFKMVKNMI